MPLLALSITSVVRGNASGKFTLSNLITLHYLPEVGTIRFGNAIFDITRESCRQQINAVYPDYYLFDRLFGITGGETQARVEAYLRLLQLDQKVRIKDGRLSTLDLSDGLRKRLAHPEFKSVFYNQILPDLKSLNKAVIVISHDDNYFFIADQLLVMAEERRVPHPDSRSGAAPAGDDEPPVTRLDEYA
jgi:putative ATP-binding cassette transporter